MKITELPEEILLKIFEHLDFQDIFQNVALVNKIFHKISQDSSLLKSLALEDIDKYVFEDFAKVLKKASKLEKLQLTDCFDFTEKIVILAFKSSPMLTTLNITDEIIITENLAKAIFDFGQNLQNLSLEEAEISGQALLHLTKLQNLKSLKIRSSAVRSEHIINLTKNCPKLKSLQIWSLNKISNEAMEEFCQTKGKFLKKIRFRIDVYPEIQWTMESFRCLEALENFELNASGLQDLPQNVRENLKFGSNLKTLSLLCLKGNALDGTNFKIPGDELQEISLKFCEITLSELVKRMDFCPKMTKFSAIGYSNVKNYSFSQRDIKALLEKCPNLKSIDFGGCDIQSLTDEFLCELVINQNIKISLDKSKKKSLKRYLMMKYVIGNPAKRLKSE